MDKKIPKEFSYKKHIKFVVDRPGHDFRYSINPIKLENMLNWYPSINLENGLDMTVDWYLSNKHWWAPIIEKFDFKKRLGSIK